MKVIVVGLGSMGKRRIRLMKQYNPAIQIVGVDSNLERCMALKELYKEAKHYYSVTEALEKEGDIICAFVCTSPLSHRPIILELLKAGLHIFTEINLVTDGYDEYEALKKPGQILFLSSTFLYRKDIQYMIHKVNSEAVNYIYHTGQYLPDWHPWERFQNFFVNEKRTNGCREIMAIEFPWIIKCFGNIASIVSTKGKLSSLPLSYFDNYMLILEHETGSKGIIAIDVVARKAMRHMEIYNENLQLFWDGTPNSLKEYNIEERQMITIETYQNIEKDVNYCENIIENAYMDEIINFFELLEKKSNEEPRHSFTEDGKILKLIDEIEA